MKYIIIIRGPAGIGKTTIGNKLAEKLRGECISIDKIMKENNLRHVPGDKCISEEKCIKANKIIIPKIKEKLNNKIVIIENNFYHKKQIEDLLKNIPAKSFIFTLKASSKTCIKRDRKREKPLGDKSIIDVFNLVSAFDYGKIINTENKTENKVVEEILKIIKAASNSLG